MPLQSLLGTVQGHFQVNPLLWWGRVGVIVGQSLIGEHSVCANFEPSTAFPG